VCVCVCGGRQHKHRGASVGLPADPIIRLMMTWLMGQLRPGDKARDERGREEEVMVNCKNGMSWK